ncbi:hypothetical protein QJQ45_008319 [Haematococcus lacustris]|nr:hypothetical protein QJQ45_008319 [Haematococcus lacustris]
MGNLCGTQAGALAAAASGLEGSDKGSVAQEPYKPAAPSSVPSRPVAATPADPIQVALGNAKVELAKNVSQKFEDVYSISKLIGHGAFAKVSICTHLSSNAKYAVKVVQKNIEDPAKQREGILKEIAIMRMLEDHPNTVRLLEVFEDADSYMLVMELCTGGELFDQIIAKGHFSEKDAAEKMHCLLDFIANAHSKNIIHRDLKPENILLSDKSPTAAIKVIDFGTSDFCAPGQRLSQKFGTPYYVAPEVLRKDYNTSADIWSAGVIMYILLCGYPPFGGKTDAKILQRVQAGKCVSSHTQRQLGVFSFEGREWEVVTEAAKDMISSMLVMDFTQRAQAKQLLTHRWFQVAATAPAAALGAHMVKRLRAFAGMSRMKRLALVVLARTLTDNDVKRLRELFAAMDTNNDGRIDSQDLHNALEKVGAAIAESEMQELFHASDIDGTGQIDYEEFIAAMLDSNRVARRKEAVRKSFEELDKDGDGFITAEDLVKVMPRGSSIELAREMVEEVDRNGDGRVDYNESLMGNLCGTQAGALAAAASGLEGSDKGSVAQEPYKPAAPSSVPSRPVAATPADPIQVALGNAKVELAKNVSQKFEDVYSISKLIGHGAFAKVSICTHLSSNVKYAVKVVQKNIEDPAKQREGILKEIAIMRMLEDHPNTVRLLEVFEDADSYMLVMELCTGGELFDQIIAKGHFSEKDAAEKMHCLLDFIANAHSKNIIHRDLKPENILLSDKAPTAAIKVIDFGTSDFCAPGQRLSQKFGTPYYVAPEVLRKDYNTSADIWSAGVIMYILLCGYPPFGGKTDAKILQRVQAGKCVSSHTQRQLGVFSFEGREWEVVTEAAKDMISSMLVMDFTQRAQAKQLLTHRWFQVAATAPAAALGAHMVKRLRAFAGMSRMKRLALVVLARTLTDNDVKRLRELFAAMDTNNDGRIDSQDLHNALEKVGAAIAESEMQELFHASDIDGTGQIDYEEFIAAMLDSNRVARRKEAVRKSFEELDKDGDGFITAEDLVKVMPRGSSIELAREMVEEVDRNGDGRVDYNEIWRWAQSVPHMHGHPRAELDEMFAIEQRAIVKSLDTLSLSTCRELSSTFGTSVPEDPDSDIEDRDEALQPDLTEAQQNRKVSGEARAARDRDNTYHGRKCKIAHLIDHLPQELWDAFLADAVQPRVEAISERAVLASLLFGLLVRGLFTIHVADPLDLHGQPVYTDIPVSQAAIPDLGCRNLYLRLCRGLPGDGDNTRPSAAVAAVLAAYPELRARLVAIPRYHFDTNMVDTSDLFCVIRNATSPHDGAPTPTHKQARLVYNTSSSANSSSANTSSAGNSSGDDGSNDDGSASSEGWVGSKLAAGVAGCKKSAVGVVCKARAAAGVAGRTRSASGVAGQTGAAARVAGRTKSATGVFALAKAAAWVTARARKFECSEEDA